MHTVHVSALANIFSDDKQVRANTTKLIQGFAKGNGKLSDREISELVSFISDDTTDRSIIAIKFARYLSSINKLKDDSIDNISGDTVDLRALNELSKFISQNYVIGSRSSDIFDVLVRWNDQYLKSIINWDAAPSWANYIIQYGASRWTWLECKPTFDGVSWKKSQGQFKDIWIKVNTEHTLYSRPTILPTNLEEYSGEMYSLLSDLKLSSTVDIARVNQLLNKVASSNNERVQ